MKNGVVSLIFLLFSLANVYSQREDSTIHYRELDEFVVNRFFQKQYKQELERIKRVYPMALKAKAIMMEYESELAKLDTRREERRYSKKMNKFLKEEFTYSIRDLYTSEGRLLMQLVHRETGKTVDDIITEYSGSAQAFMYRNMAKMFDQDLKAKYDTAKTNFMTEIVITDILDGKVEFDPEMDRMTKEAFKESQRQYRQERKEAKARSRVFRAKKKAAAKETKKAEQQKKKENR